MKKNWAPAAWIVSLVLLLAYELWSLANNIPGDTLSEAVWAVSKLYPMVPFAAGVLVGHFFWQRKGQ